jgi:hypothetical protein
MGKPILLIVALDFFIVINTLRLIYGITVVFSDFVVPVNEEMESGLSDYMGPSS